MRMIPIREIFRFIPTKAEKNFVMTAEYFSFKKECDILNLYAVMSRFIGAKIKMP